MLFQSAQIMYGINYNLCNSTRGLWGVETIVGGTNNSNTPEVN